MTALSVQAAVYVLPNVAKVENLSIAQRNLTFRLDIRDDIVTLSTGNVRRGDDISGLLYVPYMGGNDPCFYGYVPQNATRLNDLPPLRFDIVGFAPWININCTHKYLNSASNDNGNTKAFLLYYPNNTNESIKILPEENPDYALDYSTYPFPVYKIGSFEGGLLMNKLAKYSGNMTDIWDSPGLAQKYNITDMARVHVEVDTGARNTIPGVWLFLLVVFGVLLFILGFTSLIMHAMQYRYRLSLQRRVASGEVDLEAMGIKRLTVPKDILNKFPLRIYEHNVTPPASPHLATADAARDSFRSSNSNSLASTAAKEISPGLVALGAIGHTNPPVVNIRPPVDRRRTRNHAYSQTNCAVCLEDYEPGMTRVRELPCLHIFHPECIDPHLSNNSSLCPICKASVLPKGYVPTHLTNATVRRERHIRRMRERYASQMDTQNAPPATGLQGYMRRFNNYVNRRFMGTPVGDPERTVTLRTTTSQTAGRSQRPVDLPRSMSFSATPAPTQQEEDEEWRSMSIWARLIKQVFPR